VKGSESKKKGKSFHFFSFISHSINNGIEIWNMEFPFASGREPKKQAKKERRENAVKRNETH
jgi:hypothetical protein